MLFFIINLNDKAIFIIYINNKEMNNYNKSVMYQLNVFVACSQTSSH